MTWWARLLGLDAEEERALARRSLRADTEGITQTLDVDDASYVATMKARSKRPHVVLGEDVREGAYRFNPRDLPGTFAQVTAATGAGKSRFVGALVQELVTHHEDLAVVVFDLKGELVELLLRAFAGDVHRRPQRERTRWMERLLVARLFEGDFLPELQLLAPEPSLDPLTQAHALSDVLAGAVEAALGIRQQAALTYLLALGIELGHTLLEVRGYLHNAPALQALAARSTLPEVRHYFLTRLPRESAITLDGIAARLDALLRVQAIRATLVGPGMLDLRQCFEPGTFSLISLGNPPLGAEGAKRTLAALLFTRLVWALYDPRRAPSRTILVTDEVQEALERASCRELLARIVTTGRSYGLGLWSVHQSTHQLDELQAIFDTNARLRILGRSGEDDARRAAEWLPSTGLLPKPPRPGDAPSHDLSFLSRSEERATRIRALGALPTQHFLVADRLAPFPARIVRSSVFDPPAWSSIPPTLRRTVERGRAASLRTDLLARAYAVQAALFSTQSERTTPSESAPSDTFDSHPEHPGDLP